MKKLNKKILISTGGTGGHVFPAYSLAQYLTNQDYSIEIVTDTRGMKFLKNSKINLKLIIGRLAQLGERHVYTVDVGGSIPSPPTNKVGA